MACSSIPVDLANPGQVFACMGLLEAADVLLGGAEGGFDWSNESQVRFELCAEGTRKPVSVVLAFLAAAELERLVPRGYMDPPAKGSRAPKKARKPSNLTPENEASDGPIRVTETFPAPRGDRSTLPLRLKLDGLPDLHVTHWCDESSRNPFKLFAGRQRSAAIARQMVAAVRGLWNGRQEQLLADPFGLTVPLGGSSFKFDARKSWTAIDAGYSPDEQAHAVEASPVVEMLAAIGLEHARPDEFETRQVRYGVWKGLLPTVLARPALGGCRLGVPVRVFRFTLELAGKNKIVTFAREERRS